MARDPLILIDGDRFTLDNTKFDRAEIRVGAGSNLSNTTIVVTDETYDPSVVFATLVTSEEDILNVDYDPSRYEKFKATQVELGSTFGSWEFGADEFGNQVTVVKKEKLNGKGHNIKITFVDFSKSKWTLETLGTTYKMRKAR